MKKKLEKHNLQISWLRFEQEIPSELEDSFYWFLDNLGINYSLTDSVEDIVIEIKKRGRGRWQNK